MIISAEECGYCGACVAVCPHGTLELEGMRIIQEECKNCTKCLIVCPVGAIKEGNHEV
jgi:heterodisulfide reductase subunit A